MKINANTSALLAVRTINKMNEKVSLASAKLSSGYKLNHVKDAPASMSVATKMRAQLNGLKRASTNAADGVSLVQTADGGMQEVHEIVKRVRELSVSAANDTNTLEDREKIQNEIDELLKSINQISEVTEYNQMKLLNGSLGSMTTITSGGVPSNDLTIRYLNPSFPPGEYEITIGEYINQTNSTVSDSFITGVDGKIQLGDDTIDIAATDSADQIKQKLTTLTEAYDANIEFTGGNSFKITKKESNADYPLVLKGSGLTNPNPTVEYGRDAAVSIVESDPNNPIRGFSSTAACTVEGNRITITDLNGMEMVVDIGRLTSGGTYKFTVEDKGTLKLQTGANEHQRISMAIPGVSTFNLGLEKYSPLDNGAFEQERVCLASVRNKEAALRTTDICDIAINKVSEMRSTLGAYQNRLESAVRNLDQSVTNTEESLSRLVDTDVSTVMSEYTLQNVILQSGIAMLAQANQRPQQLLQLLR